MEENTKPTDNPTAERLKNFGDKRHELTNEDRSKGGQTRTLRRRMVDQLKVRKYCNETCPIYEECWARELVYVKSEYQEGSKYLCALIKGFSRRLQNATIDLFMKGEDGLKSIMKGVIMRILTKVRIDDIKEMRGLLRDLGYLMDKLYGSKQRTEHSGSVNLVQEFMEAVREADQEIEEQEAE